MKLELVQGDITEQQVDAVVNAANSSLLGGGGVDGAIHRRGGKTILAECRVVRRTRYPDGLPAGQAVATTAGKLPARWVIHTVGPVYGRGDAETLRSCYRTSLAVAADLGAESVAFPVQDALQQAINTIAAADNPGVARLVLFGSDTYSLASALLPG
jgi:O-acetyl-ADP-ribose deacetylase (regulator of RNase III)